MNTVEKGDLAVAMLTARFLRSRFVVLKPISDGLRFDLVINRGNGFETVQCKSASIRLGCVTFGSCSSRDGKPYRGEADLFGVYCAANDTCYLVPVDDVGLRHGYLRVERPRNGQRSRVRYAEKYIVS